VGKTERKRPFGRHRLRYDDNIKIRIWSVGVSLTGIGTGVNMMIMHGISSLSEEL